MSRTFKFNHEHVAERKVRNEYVLIPVTSTYGQNGQLLDLNPLAARIWEAAKEGASESSISDRLAEEYEASPQNIIEDVSHILDELVAFGALVEIP